MQIVLHPYVSNSSLFVPEHILLLISDPHTEKGEEKKKKKKRKRNDFWLPNV